MDHSVQGCFLPQNTCRYCGAGSHNSYLHDNNCLINVLEHTPKLIYNWKCGFEGRPFNPGLLDTQTQKQAWDMVVRCAEKKLEAERTVSSPKQGTGIDLTL